MSEPPRCAGCGIALTGHTPAATDDGPPAPGAVSLCRYCGHVALFDEGGGLREPTLAERAELLADPAVRAARRALDSTRLYAGPVYIRRST